MSRLQCALEMVEIALSIERLAYQDMNYLALDLMDNKKRSEQMKVLLESAHYDLKCLAKDECNEK